MHNLIKVKKQKGKTSETSFMPLSCMQSSSWMIKNKQGNIRQKKTMNGDGLIYKLAFIEKII